MLFIYPLCNLIPRGWGSGDNTLGTRLFSLLLTFTSTTIETIDTFTHKFFPVVRCAQRGTATAIFTWIETAVILLCVWEKEKKHKLMKIPWRFSKRPGYIKGKVLTISYCGQRKILVIFLSLKHHLSVIATLPSHFFPRKPSLQEHVKSSLASSHVPSLMQGFGWHGFLAERNSKHELFIKGIKSFCHFT